MAQVERRADGIDELAVSLAADADRPPPVVTVSFSVPQRDIHHKWSLKQEATELPPDWKCRTASRICSGMPLVSFLNANDRNRILVAASEAKRTVVIEAGLREEDCRIVFSLRFFTELEAPISAYAFKVRFDGRDVFFGDAVSEGTRWMERASGLVPTVPPPAAYEPLYSTWYAFHQDVHAADIEAECAEAAKLGMKTLIVDDGWQTDDTGRGYAHCGDWEVSTNRFPDMAAHVRRVQAMGLRYMVWYNVPFVGVHSRNYARFRVKYLWEVDGQYGCLDPRFPDVREFLCGIYERAARDWGLDGFKLDFIDSFAFRGKDPAIAEDYRGRDIKSLPEATDRLLGEAVRRIRAVKPEALIEFRQGYVGPAIRQYGNMLRAGDCPSDLMLNRIRTANLRLTSGASAVHSDMLEWHPDETPENAARFILSTIFSTIQYSVMLRTLPAEHRRMVKHWLSFSKDHRHALLHGAFRPHHFEANYPWIEAEDADERIVGVYTPGTVADLGSVDRRVFAINGTGTDRLTVRTETPVRAETFDTFGRPSGSAIDLTAGIHDVPCPVSGYLLIGTTSLKVSVFTFAIDDVAKERGVSFSEAARQLQEAGVSGFDCSFEDRRLDEYMKTDLRPANLYGQMNFFSDDDGVARAQAFVDTAVRVGCPRIMLLADDFTNGEPNEAEFTKIVKGVKMLVDKGRAKGITVMIETYGNRNNCCSYAKYVIRLLDGVPGLYFTADTGNLYFAGRGDDIMPVIKHARARIAHIHFKDFDANCPLKDVRRMRPYCSIGQGAVPNEEVARYVKSIGYDGWYTLERPVKGDTLGDVRRQIATIRNWLSEGGLTR